MADVFVALTRDRAYRPRLSRFEAIQVMEEGRGPDFDPDSTKCPRRPVVHKGPTAGRVLGGPG